MSTPPHTSPTNISYYSAHRGPVFDTTGSFHHFARRCDPVHLKNGYWKFSTYVDDRRAYMLGLNNPEDVLRAQDAGDGDYEDIVLRWVPGELGSVRSPLVGTAAAHVKAICDMRKLLGTRIAFRDAVPLYPLSTDPKFPQRPVLEQKIETGVLPDDRNPPVLPTGAVPPAKILSIPSTSVKNPSQSTAKPSQSIVISLPTLSRRQDLSRPVEPSRSEAVSAATSPDREPVRVRPFIATEEILRSEKSLSSMFDCETTQSIQHNQRKDSRLRVQASGVEDMRCHSPRDATNSTERQCPVESDAGASYRHDGDANDDGSTDTPATLSLVNLTPADLFQAQVAALPCMDCQSLEAHKSDCWINKATRSLTPAQDLTRSALHRLADDADKFDPGPWTKHYGPQQEIEEDGQTQLLGIADAIRNLDATANDTELQGLDDQCTVLLWVFKSIGEVQIAEK